MGNSSSKVKGLKGGAAASTDNLNFPPEFKRSASSQSISGPKKILVSEDEVAKHQQQLTIAQREAAAAVEEAEGLRQALEALETKHATLQHEREGEVAMLQNELARELEGQLRIAESLTQERNRERKKAVALEEKLEAVAKEHADESTRLRTESEQNVHALQTDHGEMVKDLERTRSDMLAEHEREAAGFRDTIEAGKKDAEASQANIRAGHEREAIALKATIETEQKNAEAARAELAALELRFLSLEQSTNTLEERVASAEQEAQTAQQAQADLTTQLDLTKQQLSESSSARASLQKQRDSHLSSATTEQTALASATERHDSVAAELAEAKAQLESQSEAMEGLEMRYNESVSKKSSLHEAFEAFKMELKESYERYQKLQRDSDVEKKRLKGELEELRAQSTTEQQAEVTAPRVEERTVRRASGFDEKRLGAGMKEVDGALRQVEV